VVRVHRCLLIAVALVATVLVGGSTTMATARPVAVQAVQHEPARAVPDPTPCDGCWRPRPRTSWQWQLSSPPNASRLLDVEMFDVDGFETSRRLVRRMHARDIRVICYVSAGAWEEFRPDADDFPADLLGRSNGWPGEKWIDIREIGVLGPILEARIRICARKGFDGIEFDNVDGYRNRSGFPLTGAHQLAFNVWLANAAHAHGLAAFLKNDLDQIRALEPYFDGAVNEQCHQYDECARLSRFIDAGKPVLGVEYRLEPSAFCPSANRRNFDFLQKRLKLDAWRVACR
jgi:hypothetical protein